MRPDERVQMLLQAGKRGSAERLARMLAGRRPDDPVGPRLLAVVLEASGRVGEALVARKEAVRRAPKSSVDHAALGATLLRSGRGRDALTALVTAVRLDPDASHPRRLLGPLSRRLGAGSAVGALLEVAADQARQPGPLWVEAASLAWEDGDLAQADARLARALAVDPDAGDAHALRAAVLTAAGRPGDAREHALRARELLSDHPAALRVLAEVAAREGRVGDARAHLDAAAQQAPRDPRLDWGRLVAVPPVMPSAEAADGAWRQYRSELSALTRAAATGLDAAPGRWVDAVRTAFPLHYLGGDQIDEQAALGDLVTRAMRAASPDAATLPDRPRRERLRVGFASSSFRRHTVTKLFGGWMRHLDRERFEVVGYDLGLHPDAETSALSSVCDRFVRPPGGLRGALAAIRADAPDALLFPEVGMDARVMQVAAVRLAPVQAVAWGHPVTTGLPSIDLFLSSEAMRVEPERRWTTEERVDLPGLGVSYPRPARPDRADRGALGLPADRPLVLCVQSLFKYRPFTDDLHARIAAARPEALLVFLSDRRGPVTETFRDRLSIAFARRGLELDQHVRILPRLAEDDWMRLLAVGDLFLDSPGWSGGNTTLEALALDLPCLAFPGETMRGRHTLGMLRELGLDALVARDPDDWVDRAVALLGDPTERARLRSEIARRSHVLYDDLRGVRALEALLLDRIPPAG